MIEPPWLPVAPRMTRRGFSVGMMFGSSGFGCLENGIFDESISDMDDFR